MSSLSNGRSKFLMRDLTEAAVLAWLLLPVLEVLSLPLTLAGVFWVITGMPHHWALSSGWDTILSSLCNLEKGRGGA